MFVVDFLSFLFFFVLLFVYFLIADLSVVRFYVVFAINTLPIEHSPFLQVKANFVPGYHQRFDLFFFILFISLFFSCRFPVLK